MVTVIVASVKIFGWRIAIDCEIKRVATKVLIAYVIVAALGAVLAPIVFKRHLSPRFRKLRTWQLNAVLALLGAGVMALGLFGLTTGLAILPADLLPNPATFAHSDGK